MKAARMPVLLSSRPANCVTSVGLDSLNGDWALHIHQRPLCALVKQGGMSPAEIVVNLERRPFGDIVKMCPDYAVRVVNQIASQAIARVRK